MKVRIGGMAYLPKASLSTSALQGIKSALTIQPRVFAKYNENAEPEGPIELFSESETELAVAREYFLSRSARSLAFVDAGIEYDLSEGDKSTWPGNVQFTTAKRLRDEQSQALRAVLAAHRSGKLGGILQAPPGWGKTTWSCALIAELQVPTVVVVHKEFLMGQWQKRLAEYLPGVEVGIAQQDTCDFEGKHVVLGMIHSLAKARYPKAFWRWPGLLITDETHRVGARTWAPVPSMFPARFRLGVSATPKRKDGTDNVFYYHIGPKLFAAKEQQLRPAIKRVYSDFRLIQTPNFNPAFASEGLILKFLCANDQRNRRIVELLVEAVKSGRKVLVLSSRLKHLSRLDAMFHREWKEGQHGPSIPSGYYVGGMTEAARDESAEKPLIFATYQFASEGLDIPALDTLFLTTPVGDVTQAVGRILRPYEGKRSPIVVDIRDDKITQFKGYAKNREKLYARIA